MPVKMGPEEDIVISGISGRFPDSDNVHMLRDNLMNKVDLVTDDDRRWLLGTTLINHFYFLRAYIRSTFTKSNQ
jgi:hypothetical protein